MDDPSVYAIDISKDEILSCIEYLLQDVELLSKDDLYMKYESFRRKFFKIFITCIESKKEDRPKILHELKLLLNIREEKKNKVKSDVEANIQVAEYMAKQYIYPHTGEPSLEEKKKAIDKIINPDKK